MNHTDAMPREMKNVPGRTAARPVAWYTTGVPDADAGAAAAVVVPRPATSIPAAPSVAASLPISIYAPLVLDALTSLVTAGLWWLASKRPARRKELFHACFPVWFFITTLRNPRRPGPEAISPTHVGWKAHA